MKNVNVRKPAIAILCLLLNGCIYANEPVVLLIKNISGKTKSGSVSYRELDVSSKVVFVDLKPTIDGDLKTYVIKDGGPVLFVYDGLYILGESGDSISVEVTDQKIKVTGRGSSKYHLSNLIDSLKKSIPLPSNDRDHITLSVEDYLEWHNYSKKCVSKILPVIDTWKNKMSAYAFTLIRSGFINTIIDHQSDKFRNAYHLRQRKDITFSSADLSALYDSTYRDFVSPLFSYSSSYLAGSWKPVMFAVDRKFNFEHAKDGSNSTIKRYLLYYNEGIKQYKQRAREEFIYKVLFKDMIVPFGFTAELEQLLTDYYSEPGFPKYKAYMRSKVEELRRRINARTAPDFTLEDAHQQVFNKDRFKGKLVLFDFWFTGCEGCIQMAPVMRKLEKEFTADTNIVFASVSIDTDKDKWLKSVARQKYTSGGGLQLYTGGRGAKDSIIKNNGISGYPSMLLLDAYGRSVNVFPFPDPRKDDGKQLTALLHTHLAIMKDGPYVLDQQNERIQYSFSGEGFNKQQLEQPFINYLSGYNQLAKVQLKSTIADEPSVFSKPSKLISFSDMEGNFTALKRLLQNNGVIDEELNWTFGDGHLVFGGDMFDRGPQVTECLWLIYSLEDKAKAAGGYVHFVLGNHEIMNMQGDDHYAHPKYKENAAKLHTTIKDLYNEQSELGRWLRSKNVIEKIGDLLFVHGGIGIEFAEAVQLAITDVNTLARKHYADTAARYSGDTHTRMIYHSSFGPFWYRQYYDDKDKQYEIKATGERITVRKPTMAHMDSILRQYEVAHIITGHTIVADTISTWYENKVINTDTKHAEGKSEALLIEGSKFYRVNDQGQRWLLFDDKVRRE